MMKNIPKRSFLLLCIPIVGILCFGLHSCNSTQKAKTASSSTYIKKYMDKQAFEIQRYVKDSKVERVGDSIKITFVNEVFFDLNKYELRPEAESSVNRLVAILKKYAKTYNIIQGHTDNSGDDAYNISLSYKRADEVRKYLIAHDIAPERLNAYGVGDTQPIASNETETGRAKNRRVVIWITSDYGLKEEAEARKR
ncbi:OmpA family protein [Solitalea lacus]|uniref:OmpA family protein n=1 Tax=Solitalea lacus TaxID=2911172 RepID=UPI001EDA7518|nr:OmpA family protein [Solitalea lacus]UKJ09093.1 OmpA family protein [Solitalea lacus]